MTGRALARAGSRETALRTDNERADSHTPGGADMLWTVTLLILSNAFMTAAWYGHLKHKEVALWKVILVSWGIAFFEYVLQVPANRLGSRAGYSAGQLKIVQEVITLVVFVFFARLYLGERLAWNYYVAFGFIFAAVFMVFFFKAPAEPAAVANEKRDAEGRPALVRPET